MDSKTQELLQKFSKQSRYTINLSIIQDAKKLVDEVGNEIDFVDKLQSEIIAELNSMSSQIAELKNKSSQLTDIKSYKSEITSMQKKMLKAGADLGVEDSIRSTQEYRLLDASLELIDDLEPDTKNILADIKKLKL